MTTEGSHDAAELDNRLSLSPSDPKWKETLAEWEDDQEYTVTLTIRQVSPGEFEVMDLKSEGTKEAQAEPEPEPAPMAEEEPPTRNPALRRMLSRSERY